MFRCPRFVAANKITRCLHLVLVLSLLLQTSLIASSGVAVAAAPTRQLSITAPNAPRQDPPATAPTPETPALTPTVAFTPTATTVFTATLTDTPTLEPTPVDTPLAAMEVTPTLTITPTVVVTNLLSAPLLTPVDTPTTLSITATQTVTPTATEAFASPEDTTTPTVTETTATSTAEPTITEIPPTLEDTTTPTATTTLVPTITLTVTVTTTATPPATATFTPTITATPSPTTTVPTATPTPMPTVTPTMTVEPPMIEVTATIPITGGTVTAFDGQVEVLFPAGAASEPLLVRVRPPQAPASLPYWLSRQPVEILAEGLVSQQPVHTFNQPLQIAINYDETQIDGDEDSLFLFYYDEAQQSWIPLPTDVTSDTNRLVGYNNHLSIFDFDTQNWEAARLPSVAAFQVGAFSGAVQYAYPIAVPPGPGGWQPKLELAYNSQVVDSATNKTQASWVGMGWSFDTGYIERDMHNGSKTLSDDTFTLVLNGASYRLMWGTDGRWHTDAESHLRIEYSGDPNIQGDQDRYWTVWDKSGNQYVFGGTDELHRATYPRDDKRWTWRWSLKTATNVFGQALTYSYEYEGVSKTGCGNQQENFCNGSCNDVAVYPREILYPNGKYRIQFDRVTRSDYENGWLDACAGIHFQRSLLNQIRVEHYNGSSWELVRKYVFAYATGSSYIFPNWVWNAGGRTPTLTQVQEFGADNSSLPAVTFTYGDNMHLTAANNGYKGSVEFDYSGWHADYGPVMEYEQQDGGCSNYTWDHDANTSRTCETGTSTGLYFRHVNNDTLTRGKVWVTNAFPTFRPGGGFVIRSHLHRNGTKQPYDARIGLEYGGGIQWEEAGYHAITQGPNETIFDSRAWLSPQASHMWLTYEGNGRLNAFDAVDTLTRYRVTTKRVKDLVTNQTHVFTYSYDEPAVNDPAHSALVTSILDSDWMDADWDDYQDNDRSYTPEFTEFRGHALVREKGPDGRVTLSWFRQDDIRKGQLVYQQVGEESFYDDFTTLNPGPWTTAGGATGWMEGDNALKLDNPAINWNVTAERTTYAQQDGEIVLVQFKLGTGNANTQAVLALDSGDTWRWGIWVKTDNSVVVQAINNGTPTYPATLLQPGQFKRDTWYVLMIGVDNPDLVRLWERNAMPESGDVLRYQGEQVVSSRNWRFKIWLSSGTLYLDTYSELKLLSESETKYDASETASWARSGNNLTFLGVKSY